jgi:tetratricopeptide (TPR) repeat protein
MSYPRQSDPDLVRSNRPALTPRLRRLLVVLLPLAGLLAINSLYLVSVTLAEAATGETLQNSFYLDMFLAHLALGLLLMLPLLVFGALHLRLARWRPNRYAIRAGLALYVVLLLLFGSGILLTRFGFFEVNDPLVRSAAYWVHVLAPVAALWLFLLHRLAGPKLRWRSGAVWSAAALGFCALALTLHLKQDGAEPHLVRAFEPALVQTPEQPQPALPGRGPIPPEHLMVDAVCAECHADISERHAGSMHRLSSFNNPAYRFSIEDTRAKILARDGDVSATRLCAVCHDQVPLLSGQFDDPNYDPDADPGAAAGITCLGCHAITAVNSPRGNGDYSLVDPPRYPFAFSDNPLLKAVNRQLIKAKPAFHKKTLLKPVHKRPEFCSACHKVHLPPELNHYRWLRGQNHYDSFLMSGVSGHRVDSFYYPPAAKSGCSDCHMPARAADDPAARLTAGDGRRAVHDHLFAAANTAVAELVGRPADENAERVATMRRGARVDIFGLKEDGHIEGRLHAPLRPVLPVLEPGSRWLLDVVVRTTGMGHALTQGTADSNEVWLELTVRAGERVIARSGALDVNGAVDDWAWFGNAYLLDRDGNRIERRNAQDIVVALYDHQIPPGAAALVHYALELPSDLSEPVEIEAALRYRKFDSRFYRHVWEHSRETDFVLNDLPITTLAKDRVTLPVAGPVAGPVAEPNAEPVIGPVSGSFEGPNLAAQQRALPLWERWNDYGIGLLRQGKKGESRQAEAAFRQVEQLGVADGPLNLARVLYREGRLDEAAEALGRAADMGAQPWVVAWYSGLVARDLGDLDAAIEAFEALAETRFQAARERGFDFGYDYRMLTELGRTLYERARQERGEHHRQARVALLERARSRLAEALSIDPENAAAHHNLSLVMNELADPAAAEHHRLLHERYRTDDNAVERSVTIHRGRNPAADRAAEAVAIYRLRSVTDEPASALADTGGAPRMPVVLGSDGGDGSQ